MSDCLFCKIIKKEIPSQIVYENKDILAILDINPANPGHVLLLPKVHAENMLDASGEILRNLISEAPKIAAAIMKALNYQGFNLIVNNGSSAGQMVSHLHIHLIPRRPEDGHKEFIRGVYEAGQMEEIARKIYRLLN